MPRQARIDAPGAVHHIISRSIERRKIFCDENDGDDFLNRLGEIITQSKTRCYAWALIANHFHLLLKTGNVPVATVMSRLLSGYTKHRGQVFILDSIKLIVKNEDLTPLFLRQVSPTKKAEQSGSLFC